MHYKDGTPVEIGDKATVAEFTPEEVAAKDFPAFYATDDGRKLYTGTVVGMDRARADCGVALLQPTGEVARFLGSSVICTQSDKNLVAIEGKITTIAPKYLKKLA
jgi:hypothetical protein